MTTNLEANIQARIDAEQMAELCGDQTERFWEVLANIAASRCGKKLAVLPAAIVDGNADARMDDAEAARFERTPVPFGKYAGEMVGDVPVAYWTYVTESAFNRDLIRYMRSNAYQRRQEEPE